MSPSRHGTKCSSPSWSRRETSQPSRECTAHDGGDVGRLDVRAARRPTASPTAGSAPRSTTGRSDWCRVAHRARGPRTRVAIPVRRDELAEHVVDEVDDGPDGAEVAGESAGRGTERRAGAEEGARCRRGGTGRSTASGRRRRRGDRGRWGARPSGGHARVGLARRERARRGRTGSGRCPGTRRAAAACTARAAAGGPPIRVRGRAASRVPAPGGRGTRAGRAGGARRPRAA